MMQEREVYMLLLGIGVAVFAFSRRMELRQVKFWRILMTGFHILLLGWILTVLETFFWGTALNFMEHLCYAASALFVTLWCWKICWQKGGEQS